MKKITTPFKTMLLAVVVLVMAQGCIPTTPVGGNPTITGTFEVNISDGSILQQTILDSSQHRITKKIFVDNDSIEFTFVIESNGYNTNNERLYSESFLIETDYNAIYNYGFLVGLSNGGSSSDDLSALVAGISIPSTINNASYYWQNSGSWLAAPQIGIPIFTGVSTMQDKYLVFRKQKGTSYLYFWVKLKYDSNGLNILNGKYQMDSIITGQ